MTLAFLSGTKLGVARGHQTAIVAETLGLAPGKLGDRESWDFGANLALALVMARRGYAEYLFETLCCGAWGRQEGELSVGSPVPTDKKQELWNGAFPEG